MYGMTNATADGTFRIAVNGNTAGCAGVQIQNLNNTASGPSTIGGNTYINTGQAMSRTVSTGHQFALQIFNYTNSNNKPYTFQGYLRSNAPSDYFFAQFGAYNDTPAVTSLVFSNSGGNFSTGTVLLYGVN
jgi:hypothetical protein